MAVDGKYGKVDVERGEFLEGEPVFILRGKDRAARWAILEYRDECRRLGASAEHMAGVLAALEAFRRFTADRWAETKIPD